MCHNNEIQMVITRSQLDTTMEKIQGNIRRILNFLHDCLGSPNCPKRTIKEEHVYEMYAVFTHAVEEYGKMLYLESLEPNMCGKYEVGYIFRQHVHKFNLALEKLPPPIKDVYGDLPRVTEQMWKTRLNVFNVDLDDDGNPTDINFSVDIDKLRASVWNFRKSHFAKGVF